MFYLILLGLFSIWKISQPTLLQDHRNACINPSAELGAPLAAGLMSSCHHSHCHLLSPIRDVGERVFNSAGMGQSHLLLLDTLREEAKGSS